MRFTITLINFRLSAESVSRMTLAWSMEELTGKFTPPQSYFTTVSPRKCYSPTALYGHTYNVTEV